jgi:hypothetical protein
VNKRIYIRGQSISSKEVPTQKGIVELFQFLLTRSGERIKNNDLPTSPYRSYRNDLQGKVVGPLDRILEKSIGKTSGIRIHGGLTDFEVELEPTSMSIGFIDFNSFPTQKDGC